MLNKKPCGIRFDYPIFHRISFVVNNHFCLLGIYNINQDIILLSFDSTFEQKLEATARTTPWDFAVFSHNYMSEKVCAKHVCSLLSRKEFVDYGK